MTSRGASGRPKLVCTWPSGKLAFIKELTNYFLFGADIPEIPPPPEALCLTFLKLLDLHV